MEIEEPLALIYQFSSFQVNVNLANIQNVTECPYLGSVIDGNWRFFLIMANAEISVTFHCHKSTKFSQVFIFKSTAIIDFVENTKIENNC